MENLVALKTVLDRIDGDSFDTLEGRITFQKRIYIVQALGMGCGISVFVEPVRSVFVRTCAGRSTHRIRGGEYDRSQGTTSIYKFR